MTVNDRIALIFSGSCTPACDLLALVETGDITREGAERAYRANRPGTLADGADAECRFQVMRDC